MNKREKSKTSGEDILYVRAPKGTKAKIYKLIKDPRGLNTFVVQAVMEKLERDSKK